MKRRRSDLPIHLVLIAIVALTLLPFVFVVNNSLRRTSETYHSFFGVPAALSNLVCFTWLSTSGTSISRNLRTPVAPSSEAA